MAFTKQLGNKDFLSKITKGTEKWPSQPEERDVLYFLAVSFRDRLLLELPKNKDKLDDTSQYLTHRAKALIKDLAHINFEMAQLVVSNDGEKGMPEWFLAEIVRDLPRLIAK